MTEDLVQEEIILQVPGEIVLYHQIETDLLAQEEIDTVLDEIDHLAQEERDLEVLMDGAEQGLLHGNMNGLGEVEVRLPNG